MMTKSQYKTHEQELLSIVEYNKTFRQYLEDCNFEVLALTDHNNIF